jgi:hypothetical protein
MPLDAGHRLPVHLVVADVRLPVLPAEVVDGGEDRRDPPGLRNECGVRQLFRGNREVQAKVGQRIGDADRVDSGAAAHQLERGFWVHEESAHEVNVLRQCYRVVVEVAGRIIEPLGQLGELVNDRRHTGEQRRLPRAPRFRD